MCESSRLDPNLYNPGNNVLESFRPENMKMISVTREDIENASDFTEIFEIAEELDVDLTGLNDFKDIKTRLDLQLKKYDEEPNYKDVIGESMLKAQKEDDIKRERMIKLLKETRGRLSPFQKKDEQLSKQGSVVIKGFLESEGTIHNFDTEIKEKLRLLKTGSSTIVVSGETSAGKSSVLNLLFGEEVLPTFHGNCTSVITRIGYCLERKAEVIYKNGKSVEIPNILPGKICKRLEPYLFLKDEVQRNSENHIKEVVIFTPAKILESGLVFVDSPGIGENEEMDKVIVKFVEENQIDGFLYVIKSDNAGGVDEDRLLGLLRLIREKEKEKTDRGMLQLDPQCALFVCNMWDNIREDQHEIVFNHAYQRLKLLWPKTEKSQMIRFSALKAKREADIDPDFITDNYRELLNAVRDLYYRATDKRLKSTYKWLDGLLKRGVHHLKTIVHRLDNSERDFESELGTIWEKLNTLKMKSELVINDCRKQVEEEIDKICEDFRSYLGSSATKVSITSWIESELPSDESYHSWWTLKQSLKDIILARISRELESWENEKEQVKMVKQNVESSIQARLSILDNELKKIEKDFQSDGGSISSDEYSELRSSRRCSIQPELVTTETRSLSFPLILTYRIFKPFGKTGRRMSNFVANMVHEAKLKDYYNDPIRYAKKQSEKFLKIFLSDKEPNCLRKVISSFMEDTRNLLNEIQAKIPAMVETNKQKMEHIKKCQNEGTISLEVYEHIMESLEQIKNTLSDYGEGYIFVNDFALDDLQIITDTDDSGYGRASIPFDVSQMLVNVTSFNSSWDCKRIPRGLWTAQQNGILKHEVDKPISIKIYLPNAKIQNTDSEVAKLRLFKNVHVAELLGIQKSSSPTPAFVFSGCLQPLGLCVKSRLMQNRKIIPRILAEILHGVEYIHKKKLVHMELNLNTVMIDENTNIKLSGACQSRKTPLPHDKESVPVGDFVYISPEVLRGEIYLASADIYAFGLLMFEVLLIPVFKDQRNWSLANFIDNCHPCALNSIPYSTASLLKTTQDAIQECLNTVPENRPSIEVLIRAVSLIKNEPKLKQLRSQVKSAHYQALRLSRIKEMESQFGTSSEEESSDKENKSFQSSSSLQTLHNYDDNNACTSRSYQCLSKDNISCGNHSFTGENPPTRSSRQSGENPPSRSSRQSGENPPTMSSRQSGENPPTRSSRQSALKVMKLRPISDEDPSLGRESGSYEKPSPGRENESDEEPSPGRDNMSDEEPSPSRENGSDEEKGSLLGTYEPLDNNGNKQSGSLLKVITKIGSNNFSDENEIKHPPPKCEIKDFVEFTNCTAPKEILCETEYFF